MMGSCSYGEHTQAAPRAQASLASCLTGALYDARVDYVALGKQLRDLRDALNMSQSDVAEALTDVSRQSVGHWETGHSPISMRDLGRVLFIYGHEFSLNIVKTGAARVTVEVDQDVAALARAAEALPGPERATLTELAEVLPHLPDGTRSTVPIMVNGWRRDYYFSRARKIQ